MKIEIRLTDADARSTAYYLRRRYKSKACLDKLARMAVLKEAGNEAIIEMKELERLNKIGVT